MMEMCLLQILMRQCHGKKCSASEGVTPGQSEGGGGRRGGGGGRVEEVFFISLSHGGGRGRRHL